ncbi:hypothetical protein [Flavisphingomonas formosensis]|uniref:hypothetical protein n=1 Tax=Flavisphingomonas formosensis TaxID=861534 RepID=UPI0012F7C492|nr:hypothetical protein [Sphingomonas formosensis]
MSVWKFVVALLGAAAITSQAIAGAALLPKPYRVGEETARYDRGVPTVMLEKPNGAVSITPLPMDHGSISFMVVVYNDSDRVADFDSANIRATVGGQMLAAFTEDELERAAKKRATWSAIGVALLTGAAAAAASTAHTTDHYYGRMRTPNGTYSWHTAYRDNSIGIAGATVATAAGVAGVMSIQDRLGRTLAMLGNEAVQRTTVDPDSSYGGRVVMQKIRGEAQDLEHAIDWNGETYRFGLHIPKKGDAPLAEVPPAASPGRMARGAVLPSSPMAGSAIAPVAAVSSTPPVPAGPTAAALPTAPGQLPRPAPGN